LDSDDVVDTAEVVVVVVVDVDELVADEVVWLCASLLF
jgi:hypothetical protein